MNRAISNLERLYILQDLKDTYKLAKFDSPTGEADLEKMLDIYIEQYNTKVKAENPELDK